jgi:hypothetical protein
MNKKQILQQLDNPTLDDHERERLQQLLHYMTVEGVNTTTTRGANNGSRTKSSTSKTTHTRTKKSIRTHNKP